jgi:hypothetical protein
MISIVSLLYCIPLAVVLESSQWAAAWQAAAQKLGGDMAFYQLLAWGGLFYHLYNQVRARGRGGHDGLYLGLRPEIKQSLSA